MATEQAKNANLKPVQGEVEPEKQSPAEHVDEMNTLLEEIPSQPRIDFVAALGLTERKAEKSLAEHVDERNTLLEEIPSQPRIDFVATLGLTERKTEENPKLKSEIEHSLSDADEAWVEADSEPPRTGRTRRVALKKRKTRSRSRRRAKSMSPTRNQIGQFGEIVSRLPKIENVQGGVHLHFTFCPATHVHGGYQAGAAPTPPTPQVGNITFVNSNNTCTCAQHVAETDEVRAIF